MNYDRSILLKQFEDNKSYTNSRIEYGIEHFRKGKARIKITGKDNKAIKNAKITVRQTNHEFKYGANLFMLDEFENEQKNLLYREKFKDTFNFATLPFYWSDLEPQKGEPRFEKSSPKIYRRPPLDLCIEYCKENGIEPKEHCLVYEQWTPEWAKNTSIYEHKLLIDKRIKELAERYRNDICDWEVTNETLYINNESTTLYHEQDYIEWSFECAKRHLYNQNLIINDAHCNIWNVFNGTRSAYYMQIERALGKGAKIDKIGMQYHMFYPLEDELKETNLFYNPIHIYNVLDRYSDFKKPLQITELTIPAYSYNNNDEDIQAEIIKNLYSIWFSHEYMDAIIYWNLVDGYAAYAPQGNMAVGENYYHGGLIRFDFTEKPAFKAIKKMFNEDWRTNCVISADENGFAEFKGFYGDYELNVISGGGSIPYKIHLGKNSSNNFELSICL